jgi:hypothetical protein
LSDVQPEPDPYDYLNEFPQSINYVAKFNKLGR